MNKNGFTLVEVIVTLLVVGVVAAITINIIQSNIQNIQLKEQFKKAYTTIENATLMLKTDSGGYPNCFYTSDISYVASNMTDCSTFWADFKKKLNIVKDCSNNAYANGCVPQYKTGMTDGGCGGFSQNNILNTNNVFVLSDGATIIKYSSNIPVFVVDINGKTPPNQSGYDLFSFLWAGSNDNLKLVDSTCRDSATNGKSAAQMLKDSFK